MNSDAGEESAEQQNSFYNHHLKKLNKGKLRRLRSKVDRIRQTYIDEKDKEEALDQATSFVNRMIDDRLTSSNYYESRLIEEIKQKLDRLKAAKSSGKISYKSKYWSLKMFTERFFNDQITAYNDLVEKGLIIPNDYRIRGRRFVREVIATSLCHE